MKKKQKTVISHRQGEPLKNFGGEKRRFDSEQNELPAEISHSAAKVFDAYSDIDSVNLAYDAEKHEVRISGKCTGGRIKLA